MANPPTYQNPLENDPNQQHPQHPLANYHFSTEELRVLRECNTESFFQRSLPIGTALGLGTWWAVKQGHLSANVKYGAVPKVIVGVVVGYFVGKFSYQQKCAEKIMRLPNSRLAEVLRQRQKGGMYNVLTPDQNLGAGLAMGPFTPNTPDIYSDEHNRRNRSSALDLDTDSRPSHEGLDDIYRPTLDSTPQTFESDLPLETPKNTVTYDELRKKNREEYQKKSQSIYSRPLPPEAPVVRRSHERHVDENEPQMPAGQRNKYGDTWSS